MIPIRSLVITVVTAVVIAAPAVVSAQAGRTTPTPPITSRGVGLVNGMAIDSAFNSLVSTPDPNARDLPIRGVPLRSYQFVVLARHTIAAAELHVQWDDIVVVRSGAAVLRTGRALVAGRQREPGEWNGVNISGANDQPVGPGDVLVIRAGTPHQWRPAGAGSFAYMVLKVRAPVSATVR